MNPDFADAYYGRALSYRNLEKYEKAVKDYSKSIELKPDDADMYYGRGLTYHYLGNYYYAVKDWEKAIELDPKLKAELGPRIKEAKEKLE